MRGLTYRISQASLFGFGLTDLSAGLDFTFSVGASAAFSTRRPYFLASRSVICCPGATSWNAASGSPSSTARERSDVSQSLRSAVQFGNGSSCCCRSVTNVSPMQGSAVEQDDFELAGRQRLDGDDDLHVALSRGLDAREPGERGDDALARGRVPLGVRDDDRVNDVVRGLGLDRDRRGARARGRLGGDVDVSALDDRPVGDDVPLRVTHGAAEGNRADRAAVDREVVLRDQRLESRRAFCDWHLRCLLSLCVRASGGWERLA